MPWWFFFFFFPLSLSQSRTSGCTGHLPVRSDFLFPGLSSNHLSRDPQKPSGFSFRSAGGRHLHQNSFSSCQHKSSASGEQPNLPSPAPSQASPPLPPPPQPPPTGPQVPWSGKQIPTCCLSGPNSSCSFLLCLVSARSCRMAALSALPAPLKPVPY